MSVLLNNWLNYQIHIVKLCRMNRIIMMMIHKMSISSFLSTPDWLAALIAVSSFLNVSSNKGYEDVSSEIWGCNLNQKMKPVCFMFHASRHIFCFQQHSFLYFVWDICSQYFMLPAIFIAFSNIVFFILCEIYIYAINVLCFQQSLMQILLCFLLLQC